MAEAGPSNVAMATTYPEPVERVAMAEEFKSQGNDCYKNKNYKGAIGKYHRALLQLKDLDLAAKRRDVRAAFGLDNDRDSGASPNSTSIPQELLDKAAELETSCLNNLAACILQQPEPNYSKVEYYCSQVLARNSMNSKALYRKGVAQYHLHDYEGAQQSLSTAQEITPGDSNIKKYLQLCNTAMTKQAKDEKTRYQGMFDKMATKYDS